MICVQFNSKVVSRSVLEKKNEIESLHTEKGLKKMQKKVVRMLNQGNVVQLDVKIIEQ